MAAQAELAAFSVTAMDEDDPVIAEYDVFITPEADANEELYVLQYLNRPAHKPFLKGSAPSQVRVKEKSGFIEVDVPLPLENFNRTAGVEWGEAMRKTKNLGQKAYGMASGFERAMPRVARPGAAADGPSAPAQAPMVTDVDDLREWIHNFDEANEKGHVLNTQTYGGQIIRENGKGPTYMAGTFRKNQLHLTPLNGLVQLRTQFHHIDAAGQAEAIERMRKKEEQEGQRPTEPRAFLPTVKKAGGDTQAEITQAFMKAANQEKWSILSYSHDYVKPTSRTRGSRSSAYILQDETSYDSFFDRLFVADTDAAPKLQSSMSNNEYLDAISALATGKPVKKKPTQRRSDIMDISDDSEDEVEYVESKSLRE